jgi:hypothetical protein
MEHKDPVRTTLQEDEGGPAILRILRDPEEYQVPGYREKMKVIKVRNPINLLLSS